MRDDFGVRFGDKLVAFFDQLMFQFQIVFDDSVVDYNDFAGAVAVRMSILFSGAPVRGPACVANSVNAIQRSDADGLFEISQFARCAADIQAAVFSDHGDARRVVSAIFQALQAVEYERHNAFRTDIADNSAHSENS